uniref:Uncharacterized protein n=1 Tax=Ascaris lumbricoides TaxID=6252 RepID=A0A0M3IK27_ASCLU
MKLSTCIYRIFPLIANFLGSQMGESGEVGGW